MYKLQRKLEESYYYYNMGTYSFINQSAKWNWQIPITFLSLPIIDMNESRITFYCHETKTPFSLYNEKTLMAIADVYESLSFSTSTFLLILIEGRQLSKKGNLLFMQEEAIYTHNYTKVTQKLFTAFDKLPS